ncbi:MAG: DNA repair protein RadC [Clostridia bacterium]
MSVHQGHRNRVKEKFLENGFRGMHPHEKLEFLLFFSIPRGDTNPIAHNLLERFGNIAGVFDATIEELSKVKGVGINTAILIKAIPQFAREYAESTRTLNIISSTTEAGKHMLPKFIGCTRETLYITLLDNKSNVIKDVFISEGTVNQVSVNVRKIIELSIKYEASRVILGHNHPNGLALPSLADEYTTNKVRDALALIGVDLFDHIVVADDDYVSMYDSGYFSKAKRGR